MSTQTLLIGMLSMSGVFLTFIIIAFVYLSRKNQKSDKSALQRSLRESKGKSPLGKTAFYQKLYISLASTPIINRYLFKVRMRFELVGNDDEFNVRASAAKATYKAILLTIIFSAVLMYINRDSLFMMIVSLIGVLVVVESMTEMTVNKIEDKLLNQQLDLFSEVRHAYHESKMVEEAIYDASILEENEVNFQADKIYEIMIAPDPEGELEKYYDVAPNRFLKCFAGVSYLTKEFGDRDVGGVSLYLKNINNITQELQMEILKRQKIDYYFTSLSYITLAPILCIIPIKNWAESNFASTISFYEGAGGFALQIFTLILIFICYALLKKVKESSTTADLKITNENPWQEKIYRIPIFEVFIDKLVPVAGKKKYVKIRRLLKEAASKQKMEWLYVTRCTYAFIGFLAMLILFNQLHNIAIKNILTQATTEDNVFGQMDTKKLQKAEALTAYDNYTIDQVSKNDQLIELIRDGNEEQAKEALRNELRNISNNLQNPEQIEKDANMIYKMLLRRNAEAKAAKSYVQQAIFDSHIDYTRDDYTSQVTTKVLEFAKKEERGFVIVDDIINAITEINSVPLTEEQINKNADRIYEKVKLLTNEYIKWSELVVAFLFGLLMYNVPIFVLKFQAFMRKMDMEDEIMQYQTVILMLMHIERVSVEYILEWLERFAVIFKEPISTCMNNYESGAYEALEQMKDDVQYKPLIRIIESLQSAVENVKITDAFDELETERAFFQEKRKDANERLINKKSKIGKIVGFSPMIFLFVAYLIGPLIVTSILDMTEYFSQLGNMI